MFDSGYILLPLLAAILFYMWRSAGRFALDMNNLLEKDHQNHLDAIRLISQFPDGATWKEYRLVTVNKCNAP